MQRTCILLALLGLSACSVGPDFQKPVATLPSAWSSTIEPGATASGEVDRLWWQQLGDPQLTQLVERASQSNFDVRLASNRLGQSQLVRQVTASGQLPAVSANVDYSRSRNSARGLLDPSGRAGRSPFELWSGALDASWELDLWGHVRRRVEAADAQVELTQAQRDGVRLSIAAETATHYIRLRGVQGKLAVAEQNLELARQSHALTQTRYDNGVTTNLDTSSSAALVASIEAALPLLQAERDNLINALSYLLGEAPRSLWHELIQPRAIPHPAPDVALGVPSELAQRRPDIRQSEAALRQATAAIGMAEADFYPRISLGASAGFAALTGSDMGHWATRQWSYGPSLYLPIFQGGRLTGTLELRKRQHQEAALDYQHVVLNAWHEVDNAMRDYAAEQRRHSALEHAVRQNRIALDTARDRYTQGIVDVISVLGVQRELLQAQSDLVDSATSAALNRIRLYRALGGGWPDPHFDTHTVLNDAAPVPPGVDDVP